MSNFYTLLTRTGAALHANAQVQQTTVPWTHMRLGDGNGAPVTPTETQTGLVRQVHVLPITDIAVHPDNPNWVIAEAVVPSDVGGWTVRETAIYGGADGNTCIAVGNYPETYKPVLAEGAGREMVMRMVVQISSVATVKLLIDPAVAIASRAWVESLKATPQKAGLVKLADIPQTLAGERGDVAITPQGLQAALEGTGGLPRFTPYVWGGRGDAMPEGDTQSSGQQLLDLMYPTMRADVLATQFCCTEAQWQADPYKRLTHWSLGDGASWMRPPDKNCVQPGSLDGGFYGSGVGSDSVLLGTAVLDQFQGHTHGPHLSKNGGILLANAAYHPVHEDEGEIKSDGVNGTPRVGPITRPRTWYGIWMIRMYGRVVNTGLLDAPALNARMDMLDARVATLEGRHKALGDGQARKTVTRSLNTNYTHPVAANQSKEVRISAISTAANADVVILVSRDGGATFTQEAVCVSIYYTAPTNLTARAIILPGEVYKFLSTNTTSVTFSEVS